MKDQYLTHANTSTASGKGRRYPQYIVGTFDKSYIPMQSDLNSITNQYLEHYGSGTNSSTAKDIEVLAVMK